jgi:D-apionolactonase
MTDEPRAANRMLPSHDDTPASPPDQISLRAGPWRLVYTAAELRHLCLGRREVLSRIYVGVRDRFWNTVPAHLSNLRVSAVGEMGFELTFLAHHADTEVDFAWYGAITGDSSGRITYRLLGEAQRGFWRSRIGICVLHPSAECAGQPCRVTHVDGSVEASAFPTDIAPHQVFFDMRAIAHLAAPGVWAEVRLEGEVFEMEDQRNWSDGSFKTYCTPLRLPYPVWMGPGTKVEQSAIVTLSEKLPAEPAQDGQAGVCIDLQPKTVGPLPRLGLGFAGDGEDLTPSTVERLQRLRLAHLRADLALDQPGWQTALQRIAADSLSLGLPVELALIFSADAPSELERLAELRGMLPEPWAWLIFERGRLVTPTELVRAARPVLQRLAPSALIGGGSDLHFAQLNRFRPPAGLFDLLSYPVTPQMHAEDDETMVESLAVQAEMVRAARSFAGGARVAVSPITLKPRFNPFSRAAGAPAKAPSADSRQASLFAAGWTAISFKHLAESGADSATYFETTGTRGVMPAKGDVRTVFPLFHILQDIGEFSRGVVIRCVSSRSLRAEGLCMAAGRHHCLLVVSFANVSQTISVAAQGYSGISKAVLRFLDETNLDQAVLEPGRYRASEGHQAQSAGDALQLQLLPFAIARLDWEEPQI